MLATAKPQVVPSSGHQMQARLLNQPPNFMPLLLNLYFLQDDGVPHLGDFSDAFQLAVTYAKPHLAELLSDFEPLQAAGIRAVFLTGAVGLSTNPNFRANILNKIGGLEIPFPGLEERVTISLGDDALSLPSPFPNAPLADIKIPENRASELNDKLAVKIKLDLSDKLQDWEMKFQRNLQRQRAIIQSY